MLYKDHWESAKKRFEAFWARDMLDRCCISVTAPRTIPLATNAELRVANDLFGQWTDPEIAYGAYDFVFSLGYHGGEALPITSAYMGPGVVAAFIGADYTLRPETVWFGREPAIQKWEGRRPLRLIEDHELWKAALGMTRYYSERAPGRHLVGMTDLGGAFDIAVSLRGAQELIFDLIDCPEEVERLVGEIDEVWFRCFDELYAIMSGWTGGMSAWIPLYFEGRWYPLQCDFCANLSPRMFDNYVRPSLEREAARLDRAVYHLDGPDALKFVDSILDIDRIDGIQWVPGDTGVPESSLAHDAWFPLYEKIQKKGKCLVLMDVRPEEVEKILSRVSSKGLFITTRCDSQDDADELIRCVGRWSRG
ncbi:MAG TPA: hypothetical protein VLM75_13005 [Spirochaetota bacterium]|nr:hypothetical protein [Spirochaetota bacterium]